MYLSFIIYMSCSKLKMTVYSTLSNQYLNWKPVNNHRKPISWSQRNTELCEAMRIHMMGSQT